jgi:hypothetical protein
LRKFLCVLFILALVWPLTAQERTGNIYGRVVDTDGNPLPGVTVTLTGSKTAPLTAITSAEGRFRFISLPPASDYAIKVELEGFKTVVRENIIVVVGRNVDLTLTMEMGALEEEVTVIAETPVVDTKKTTVGANVTREVLQSLPTARDPWVILQMAPGVMVDRENVGGSESGQQAGFMARGGGSDQWAMDGVVITDPSAISSPSYYDFDAFEEMNITTGGADVTVQTGGVQINLVTRRGGNQVSLGGRIYLTDSKFQAENLTDELRAEGVRGTNVIRNIKDYGFNFGGPIFKDKAWYWMSFGAQDIKTTNIYGTPDDTLLVNYAAKINAQIIPENRFEAFAHIGQKEKWGRSSSYSFPGGWHQTGKYHFGSPIVKFQDEHMFGDNLFVSVKYSFSDAGFNLIPMDDEDMQNVLARDVAKGIWYNTYYFYRASRPVTQFNFLANYFNDNFMGASHEIKIGFEYADRNGQHQWRCPGNMLYRYNYHYLTVDITGDNVPDLVPGIKRFEFWRGWRDNNNVKAMAVYFSDTINIGRLNIILGLRYDRQQPQVLAFTKGAVNDAQPGDKAAWESIAKPDVITTLDRVLPGLEIPAVKPDYAWNVFSPRIGLTYDVFGTGKTIAKLSFAQYGEFMGTGWASNFLPSYTGGWMDFWWFDATNLGGNGDGMIDLNELYWTYGNVYQAQRVFDDSGNFLFDPWLAYGYMWGGYDIDDPQKTKDPRYTVDKSAGSMRTTELILGVEHELLPDFGVALDFFYRKLDHFNWTLEYDPTTGDKADQGEYVQVGTVPSQVGPYSTEDGAGRPYYLKSGDVPYRYYRYIERRPDFYRDYKAIEFRFTKRLSHRWMFNGSITLQDQRQHYGAKGYLNPTNLWAIDGKIYAPSMGGGSGKISMHVFSHWLVKLAGLYQLPLDFNISFSFNARQGHVIPFTVGIVDYNAPNPYNRSITVYCQEFGKLRLPNFWNLDIRLEKVIKASETGRIYIMADIFNVFNNAHMNRRYDKHLGTYYVHNGYFAPNPTNFMANEVLNPRVMRLGIRFQF